MLTGVTFNTYNAFSDDALRKSTIAIAFLTHEMVKVEDADNTLTIEDVVDENWIKSFEEGKEYVLVSEEPQGMTLALNDQTFEIPYIYHIYNTCKINKVVPKDNGAMDVYFMTSPDAYHLLFSKKTAEEIFPTMKSLV